MFIFSLFALGAIVFTIIPPFVPQFGYVVLFASAFVALLLDVLAFSIKYYDYLVFPLMQMKKRTAIISNEEPFYISQNGNAIVVRGESVVYASSFIKIPIFASASEMPDEEKFDFAMAFARVASIGKEPVRVSAQMYIVNKDEYIKRINEKMNQVQDLYNQIINAPETPPNKVERIKGEVTMWHNLFDNVSRSHSQTLSVYAMVTAIGGTEEEAVNLAVLRAEETAAGISSTLGVTASLAREEDILVLIEPDHMIPSRTVDEMMQSRASAESMG